jgi:hypothetical protein
MFFIQRLFKTIEFVLVNFLKNKNISFKIISKFIIQQYYLQLVTLFNFDFSKKYQIIYKIKTIRPRIIHFLNFLYCLNSYIEKFQRLNFYFKPFSYNYVRIIWRILIDKFDFYFLLENLILNFIKFFLKFTRIFFKKLIYLLLDYVRLIFSLLIINFIPHRITLFLLTDSIFNNYNFFLFFIIYNCMFGNIMKKASSKYVLHLAFMLKKSFLYRYISMKSYFLSLKVFLALPLNKNLSKKIISDEIALKTFPVKTVLFYLFKQIYRLKFSKINYNKIPNLYNKIQTKSSIISRKNIDFFIYYNFNLVKFLIRIAFLIFLEKQTQLNCIWFLEIKLGKYLLFNYLKNYNNILGEFCVYLCMCNNKFILIFIKYINRYTKTLITIKNILKKNWFTFITKLIGIKVCPIFFFVKIFKKINLNFSCNFIKFLSKILIKLNTLFGLNILEKSVKHSLFFEKKNQCKKKIHGCRIFILKFNQSFIIKFYLFSLFLSKEKVNSEFKKINCSFFKDFKKFNTI